MSDRKSFGRSSLRSSMRSSILGDRIGGFADDISVLLEPTLHTEDVDGGHPIRTGAIAFNLLQSTMGVGILSLSGAVSQTGIVISSVLLIILSIAAVLSVTLLMKSAALQIKRTARESPRRDVSFESLAFYCFGTIGSATVQFSLIGMCLVAMTSFLVPLKSFLYLIFSEFSWFKDQGGQPNSCLLIALLVVIVPLSMMKRVDKLWITSMMGVLFILTFVVVSTAYTFYYKLTDKTVVCRDGHKSPDPHESYKIFPSGGTDSIAVVLSAISIIMSTFICQLSIFPMFKEVILNESITSSSLKMIKSTKIAITGVFFLYLTAATSGYILWKSISEKPSSILACYDPSIPLIAVVYIGMSFSLMFSFPLVLFSARQSIISLIHSGDKEHSESKLVLSTNKHILMTMMIVVPVTGVAMVVSSLSSVLGVGGSFFAPLLSFVLPAACFLKMTSKVEDSDSLISFDFDTSSPTCSPTAVENDFLLSSPSFTSPISLGSPHAGAVFSFSESAANQKLIKPTQGERTAAWMLLFVGVLSHISCIVGSLMHAVS